MRNPFPFLAFFLILPFIHILTPGNSHAQIGITAVPFLQIIPGAESNITAGTYTALPTTMPGGFFHNPAQLGNFGESRNFSFQFNPQKTDWMPELSNNSTLQNTALAVGYNLKNTSWNIPVSIGLGYMNTELDLGEQSYRPHYDDDTEILVTSSENYDMYSFGVRLDYGLRFNAGVSYKKITSGMLVPAYTEVTTTAVDVGFQVTMPFDFRNISTRATVGYAIRNLGDEIQYENSPQPDPLPRKAVLGYGIHSGYHYDFSNRVVELVSATWSLEASEILAKADNIYWRYIRSPGNISVLDNVIMGNSDDQVTVRYGWRIFTLDRSLSFGRGQFKGPGWPEPIRTIGLSVSSRFLLQELFLHHDSNVLHMLANHFDISYFWSKFDPEDRGHPLNNTTFRGITVSILGF